MSEITNITKYAVNSSLGTDEFVPLNERPLQISSGNIQFQDRDRLSMTGIISIINSGDNIVYFISNTDSQGYTKSYDIIEINNNDNSTKNLFHTTDTSNEMALTMQSYRGFYDENSKIFYFYTTQSGGISTVINYISNGLLAKYVMPFSVYDCIIKLPYIYFTTGKRIIKYNVGNNTIEKEIKFDSEVNFNNDTSFYNAKKDFWYVTKVDGSLYRFDVKNETYILIMNIPTTKVNCSYQNPNGLICLLGLKIGKLGYWNGVGIKYKFIYETETIEIHESSKYQYWFGLSKDYLFSVDSPELLNSIKTPLVVKEFFIYFNGSNIVVHWLPKHTKIANKLSVYYCDFTNYTLKKLTSINDIYITENDGYYKITGDVYTIL